jgi:hypothetical protein
MFSKRLGGHQDISQNWERRGKALLPENLHHVQASNNLTPADSHTDYNCTRTNFTFNDRLMCNGTYL